MSSTTGKATMTLPFKAFILFLNFFFISAAVLCAAVLLIGAYHTSIFLIAHAWAPVFHFTVPAVTLSLAIGVIFLKQPVHNLLCLITVFFTTTLLYLYAGAEFLAFLFLIVYVGAIAILFLFVIMLLHLKELTAAPRPLTPVTVLVLALSAAAVILGSEDLLAYEMSVFFAAGDSALFSNTSSSSDLLVWFVNNQHTDILTFSHLLYTYHSFLFYLASLLLLTAMLGAIILAATSTDIETIE
jgi:NADH-quinone oxidoreductase subunit J